MAFSVLQLPLHIGVINCIVELLDPQLLTNIVSSQQKASGMPIKGITSSLTNNLTSLLVSYWEHQGPLRKEVLEDQDIFIPSLDLW